MYKNDVNDKIRRSLGWAEALVDAGRRLKRNKGQSAKWEEVIAIIKRKIEANEPWPGTNRSAC